MEITYIFTGLTFIALLVGAYFYGKTKGVEEATEIWRAEFEEQARRPK